MGYIREGEWTGSGKSLGCVCASCRAGGPCLSEWYVPDEDSEDGASNAGSWGGSALGLSPATGPARVSSTPGIARRPASVPSAASGIDRATPLSALRPFASAETQPTIDNTVAIMKAISRYHGLPWRIGYTILQHEGGVRLFVRRHPDGVMQTTSGARHSTIPRIPRDLKLTLIGRSPSDPIGEVELNRMLHGKFRRSLSVQIATGVQELQTNLLRFSGYVALAFVAYNAGAGWAYFVATQGRSKRRPGPVSVQQWENMCRFGAALYHQPQEGLRIEEGSWQCDANIPAWFGHIPVFDRQSGLQLITFKYLRRIRECIRGPKPSVASCTRATHGRRGRRRGTGPIVCTLTRPGALDKLYDPRLLGSPYYEAVRTELLPIPMDPLPLKVVGEQLRKMPLASTPT